MTLETALAIFYRMQPAQQAAILTVFAGIAGAFADVREAFAQAVADECFALYTEMMLLQTGVMQQ
jgi:hypothetical protein